MNTSDIVLVVIGFMGVVALGLWGIDYWEERKRRKANREYFNYKTTLKK